MAEVSFWTGPAAVAKLRAMLPYIHNRFNYGREAV